MGMSVWEEENGEERGMERVCFLGKKEFVFETQRDSFLNAQVINAGTKEGDGSAIRRGMKLMKWWICFRITAKLWNSKGPDDLREWKLHFVFGCVIYRKEGLPLSIRTMLVQGRRLWRWPRYPHLRSDEWRTDRPGFSWALAQMKPFFFLLGPLWLLILSSLFLAKDNTVHGRKRKYIYIYIYM